MYFLRRLRPLEVAGERVRSLRLSLNAPVLSAADLPVGPARAVIVVHRDLRGRMDATVGVRSARGGEVAYWSFDGDLLSDADLDVASDAALTFAESLGFLFDEMPHPGGGAAAEKAFTAWLEGHGNGESATRHSFDDTSRDALGDAEPSELMLEDLVVEEAAALAPRASAKPPAPKTLSKFRANAADPSAQPARKVPLRRPLARVQLVKRRSPEEERKLLIRKLVTSF